MSLTLSTIFIGAVMAIIAVIVSLTNTSRSHKVKMEPFERDYADWYYEDALQSYCSINNMQQDQLNDDDEFMILEYASNHISMFLTWAIIHDFIGKVHLTEDMDAVECVKKREMTGTQFFVKYCDCKLWREDFSEEILPFVDYYYYGIFLDYYERMVRKKLKKSSPFFPFQWDDYDVIEKSIDKEYKHWKRSQ